MYNEWRPRVVTVVVTEERDVIVVVIIIVVVEAIGPRAVPTSSTPAVRRATPGEGPGAVRGRAELRPGGQEPEPREAVHAAAAAHTAELIHRSARLPHHHQ